MSTPPRSGIWYAALLGDAQSRVASMSPWLRAAGPFAVDVLRVGVCRVVRDGRDAWVTCGTDGRLIASHDRPPRP